jgi:simple sugar transport system permease protein
MNDVIESLLNSGVRFAVPLLLAALGELVSQRAGVVNIGIEGYMAVGACTGFVVALNGGGTPLALVLAAVAGLAAASLMAIASVWLGANQILVGFALFVLLPGLTAFLYLQFNVSGSISPIPAIQVPVLSDLPLVGRVLFQQNGLFYLALLVAVLVAVLFTRTRHGLAVVAVGHDLTVASTRGIRPRRVQAAAVLFCGLMSGIAGASLAIGSVGTFSPGLIDGRGLIVIAIVILGRWSVAGVLMGSLLIGVLDAAQLVFSDSTTMPIQAYASLPWLIVLAALLLSLKLRSNQPRSL